MRKLTFKGFLAQYVKALSLDKTMRLHRLVPEAATTNPRLREPLFLYALYFDKVQVLLSAAAKYDRLSKEYHEMAQTYTVASMDDALQNTFAGLADEYKKIYRSYVSIANRHQTEEQKKMLMRERIVQRQKDRNISSYRICKDLNINAGNANAFLNKGDITKVSTDTARKMLNYVTSIDVQTHDKTPA